MNINDYIINVGDNKYIEDSIYGEKLLIKKIKEASTLPSNGEDYCLYIINDVFYYKSGLNNKQIIPIKVDFDVYIKDILDEDKGDK
jgi:hypothetical protein